MEKVPITRQGHRDLRRDLRRLRREARPEALEELREARAFGVKIDNQQYLLALERWFSVESPVGNGLLGRFAGDEVTVCTPGGLRAYRILSIRA